MIIDYKSRPTTNDDFLFRSLGSFWTQIFRDREALKGYTQGQAEEIIQRYIDVIEAVKNYSVKDSPMLHTEKWKPIQLLKSQLNQVPFVFEPNGAVFGVQPDAEEYYRGIMFKFGFKKEPNQDIFQYYIGNEFKTVGFLADRVISPTEVYIHGSDYVLSNGALIFNKNIFEDSNLEKFEVIGEEGIPVTYVDKFGVRQQEQSAIIWVYNAEIDVDYLFDNFGYIFDLYIADPEVYRAILEKLFATIVNGPTVANIKNLCAIALSCPFVLNAEEVVESVFEDASHKFVVTDKECYRIPLTSTLIPLVVGKTLYAGQLLTTDVEYYDNSSSANGWWKKTGLVGGRLAFSKNLFLGNYSNQLSFSSELEIIALDGNGNIVFPVLGHPEDVKKFNAFLNNSAARKTKLKTYFSLSDPGSTASFVPLDFIMDNFLKLNVAFMKFKFSSDEKMADFLRYIPLIRSNLPPYVYLLLKFDLTLPTESYSSLNGEVIQIPSGVTDVYWSLNADASDANGYIERTDGEAGYLDVKTRLFEIGRVMTPQLYELVGSPDVIDAQATTDGRRMTVKAAALIHPVPDHATTANYNKLLLLDFS